MIYKFGRLSEHCSFRKVKKKNISKSSGEIEDFPIFNNTDAQKMKGFVHNSVTRFHEVVSPLLGKAKNKCEEISPKIKSFKQKIGINIVDNNGIILATIFPIFPPTVGHIFAGGAWVRKKIQRNLIEKQRREAQFC